MTNPAAARRYWLLDGRKMAEWPNHGEPKIYRRGVGRVEVRWRDGLAIRRRVVRLQRGENVRLHSRGGPVPGSALDQVLRESRRAAPRAAA